MENQIWHLPGCSLRGGSQKKNNGLCQHFCLRESSPQLLPSCQTISSFLYVPGSFQAAAPALALRRGKSEEVHAYPLREAHGTPATLQLTQPQSLLVCTARSYGDFSSWHWNPWLRAQCGAGTPCSSEETSTAKILLLIFIHPTRVQDQPIPQLCPSYQSQCAFFFNSLLVKLPFSQTLSGSE